MDQETQNPAEGMPEQAAPVAPEGEATPEAPAVEGDAPAAEEAPAA